MQSVNTNENINLVNPHLDGGPFFWRGGSTGILLIHGFTATTAEVRPLAIKLAEAGYSVSGPLLPGHNTDPRDLNRVTWRDWVDCVELSYEELRITCQKVIIGGESTGGLLALYLALFHPEVSALLLYAPALQLNLSKSEILKMHLVAPVRQWIPKENLDSRDNWQGYFVNPLKGAIQLLKLQNQVRPNLSKIHQPVLIVQGRLDSTVHPLVPDTIYQQVSSTIKEEYWMEKSAHCVVLDQELTQVAEITTAFLERVLKQ